MNNIGTIISILVGLATLLSMFVWFGRFIQRVNVHDKKLDELTKDTFDIKKLITIHDQKLDVMSREISSLRSDVDGLKQDTTSIKALLMANFKEFGVVLAGKHSPRALNEMGQKIFEDMHGKEFLEKNKALLFAYVDKDKPKTAYDVEGLCYLACLMNVNNDAFIEIKSFLYNYPTITMPDGKPHEVTMDEACSVLSLPLRDMYLEEHPDIVR
nr:MAG TPA: hypothetical protein [Caudoviricetes sp.]